MTAELAVILETVVVTAKETAEDQRFQRSSDRFTFRFELEPDSFARTKGSLNSRVRGEKSAKLSEKLPPFRKASADPLNLDNTNKHF